jgi:hypothetical protein
MKEILPERKRKRSHGWTRIIVVVAEGKAEGAGWPNRD